METLFEIKQGLATIGEQLQKTESEITAKALDPKASATDLSELEASKASIQQRYNILKKQHDEMEAEQRANLEAKNAAGKFTSSDDPQQKVIDAKAALIRNTMSNKGVTDEVKAEVIGGYDGSVFKALIDDKATGGSNFIPKNTGTQVITEPVSRNPLRKLSTFTTIPNLELPKITFTLDDDDFIEDGDTAKELKAKGSLVTFGRHKFKVFSDISETVLNGTNTDVVSTVETNLKSGVETKEKKVAYAVTPKSGEEHMSFYDETIVKIKRVKGDTMFRAILNSIADLEDGYAEVAKVTMRKADYLSMIETLANGSESLFGKKPEEVIGYPVEFCDKAVKPVIGDFDSSHFNYDIDALYESDKNIKTGMNSFVVTAWFDHQIKLASAFRIAEVKETP